MKARKKYRITIEDESRLKQIVSVSARPYAYWMGITVLLLLILFMAILIIAATPIRTMLPGYMKETERTAAEKGLLRIDSIRDSSEMTDKFLANILTVLDTNRAPSDSVMTTSTFNELPPDSLLPASPREREFIKRMKDREKYNLSVLAPIAGEQLRIFPVANGFIVDEKTQNATKARILTPKGSPVCAISDGRILAVQTSSPEKGSSIVIQHDNGFASRYSHLGTPTVSIGEHIDGGAVIALGTEGGALSPGYFFLEMWYDGTAIPPEKYLNGFTPGVQDEPYTLSGKPMGR